MTVRNTSRIALHLLGAVSACGLTAFSTGCNEEHHHRDREVAVERRPVVVEERPVERRHDEVIIEHH